MTDSSDTEEPTESRPNPYKHLPEQVELADTIESKEANPVPDPQMGHNTDNEFMLRHAGFS